MKRVRDFHAQSWNNPFFSRSDARPGFPILSLMGFIIIPALVVYAFVFSPFLRLGNITVSGASSLDPLKIKMIVAQTISGYDYFVIPKDHYFIVNALGVKNFVVAQFPNLLDVKVNKHFGKLEVSVIERQPTFRLIIGERSYLLDQEAKGLRQGAPNEGDALVALSSDTTIFAAGKTMVRSKWLEAINDLHQYFATQVGIRDKLYKLDSINNDIEVVTVEGWSAIFDPQSEIAGQLKTLSSALTGKFTPASRKKLLYIDARFGDKIFYKANE